MKVGINDTTLLYYQKNAAAFAEGTLQADMQDAQERFLKHLPLQGYILDFGCGSGRDTKVFLEKGYRVDASDGSPELCKIASEYTGISVKQMLFHELDARNCYDGIWACSSILHLPRQELCDVMQKISEALKSSGVLYTSFKYGEFEGFRNGRYFSDFTEDSLQHMMEKVPSLQILDCWITQDVRPGREEEQWINILARRI